MAKGDSQGGQPLVEPFRPGLQSSCQAEPGQSADLLCEFAVERVAVRCKYLASALQELIESRIYSLASRPLGLNSLFSLVLT